MQPIGLYVWLSNRINDQGKVEESHFEAKKLNLIEWMRYLALCAVIWIGMGFSIRASIVLVLSVIVSPMRLMGWPVSNDPPIPGAMDLLDW